MKLMLMIVLLASSAISSQGWWWPFEEEKEGKQKKIVELEKGKSVPFEIVASEQKFLLEAKHIIEMSELDYCLHEVVEELRESCGDMNEEELAKMSVKLLNCQSQAEGREIFPCTDEMSVAECTGAMDPHMWNAYHIVSNRARSVCYATRQKQFRYQTEAAVNTLTHSTFQQIKIMEGFANSHEQLRKKTNESLEYLKVEQELLLQKQESLSASQNMIKNSIKYNLNQLAKERHLVEESKGVLRNMTEQIKHQIEMAQTIVAQQEERHQQYQNKLDKDIEQLSENFQKVWIRIDNSTDQLLKLLTQMTVQYETTLHNLKAINDTVLHVLTLLDTMNSAVNIQLSWLLEKLGGAQDGLRVLTTVASHVLFLLLSCLILLFLRAPWVSRASLLGLVILNVGSEVYYNVSLSLGQLTVIMATVLLVEWCYQWYNRCLTYTPPMSISQAPPQPISDAPSTDFNPLQTTIDTITNVTMDTSDEEVESVLNRSGCIDVPSPTKAKSHDRLSMSRDRSVSRDRVSVSHDRLSASRESTPLLGTPIKCGGITRNGGKCRLRVLPGSRYCRLHC